ncbi:MAG: hypothetical protein KC586_18605 [Myxococcales bacterium]|nr:hypothetical protein [Myxococcales bacterium]
MLTVGGMKTLATLVLAALALAAIPTHADAQTMIYVNGLGSTHWLDGNSKGSTPRNANLSWINTHVDVWADQRYDHQQAVASFKAVLDQHCMGTNWCYVMAYSNGGAVVTEAMSVYGSRWPRLSWAFTTAGNQGGSELADLSWMSELFGGCDMADEIAPSVHRRPGFNHNAMPAPVYNVGGDGWCWGCGAGATHAILPGNDDGVVAPHSTWSYSSRGSYDHGCQSTQWSNHYTAYRCDGVGEDHFKVKTQHIQCLESGGC